MPTPLKRIIFHGATGPRHQKAVKIMRMQAAASPPADTMLSNHASELLQSLLSGTASDPVAACREYEEIGRKIALARGEQVNFKGTTCDAPAEAVRYYYRYTAQITPRYFGDWDFTTALKSVSAPLMVVYGRQDALPIPAQREWASAVANGRLLLVPGAGKAAFSDNPEFVFAAIDTFLKGKWPKAAALDSL